MQSVNKTGNPFLHVHKLASTLTFNHLAHIFNELDHFTPEGSFLARQTLLPISFPHISNLLPLSVFMGAGEKSGALQLLLSALSLSGSRRWAVSQFALCAGWREGGDVQLGGEQRAGSLHYPPAGLSTQPDCTVSRV